VVPIETEVPAPADAPKNLTVIFAEVAVILDASNVLTFNTVLLDEELEIITDGDVVLIPPTKVVIPIIEVTLTIFGAAIYFIFFFKLFINYPGVNQASIESPFLFTP
jgi:hypothetical protein